MYTYKTTIYQRLTLHSIASIGMFDGVHLGHRLVLDQLCALAARTGMSASVFTFVRHPLAVINPSRSPRLITTPAQKCSLIAEAGVTDVHFFDFDAKMRQLTAQQFMTMLYDRYGVRALVMGYNHHFGSDRLADYDDYRRVGEYVGIDIVRAHELQSYDNAKISSTVIRQLVVQGDVANANRLLGHPFALSGMVGHGRGVGHTIGFPTANVKPYDGTQLVPGRGVYAAVAQVDDMRLRAMVNVGYNPTVDNDSTVKVEAHLIDFDGDIYGRPITVSFVRRLRDERKFDSLQSLQQQLLVDLSAVKCLLE